MKATDEDDEAGTLSEAPTPSTEHASHGRRLRIPISMGRRARRKAQRTSSLTTTRSSGVARRAR